MKVAAKCFVVVSLLGLAATACCTAGAKPATFSSAYPKAAAAAYTKSCVSVAKGAAAGRVATAAIESYCGCSISYIEARLTFSQFLAESQAELTFSAGSKKAKAVFGGALGACEGRLGLG
jgi:hypothetical protein